MFGPPVIGFTVVGCGTWLIVFAWAFTQRRDREQWHHLAVLAIATGFWWIGELLAIRLGKYEYAVFPSWATFPFGSGSASDPDLLYKALHRITATLGETPPPSTCQNTWSIPFAVVALESALVFTMLRLSVLRFKGRGWRPAIATAGFNGLLTVNLAMVADPVVSITNPCAPVQSPHTLLNVGLWSWITYDQFRGYWYGVPYVNYAAWLTAAFVFGLVAWHYNRALIREEKTWPQYLWMVFKVIFLLTVVELMIYMPIAMVLGKVGELWQRDILIGLIALAGLSIFLGRAHHKPEYKLLFWSPQFIVLGSCLVLLIRQPNAQLYQVWLASFAVLAVVIGWPLLVKLTAQLKGLDLRRAART